MCSRPISSAFGRQIGCYVTVLEDRPKFADNAEEQEQTKLFVIHLKRDWKQIPVIQIRFL